MLLSGFCFALMNVFMKFVSHLPAVEIVFFRSIFTLFATYFALKINNLPLFGENKKLLLMRGFFGTIALNLYVFTLQKIPLAAATVIQYLSPIFTTVIAFFFLKETIKAVQWAAFLICFAGVFLMKGFDVRFGYTDLLFGIISAAAAGAAYNVIGKIRKKEHPLVIVFYFPLISLPVTAILCLFWWEMPQGTDWLYLFLSGATTQAAQYYMTRAYQADDASKVSIYTYVGVIYSLSFGYLFFDETYPAVAFLGLFLVIFGVVLSLYFTRKQ